MEGVEPTKVKYTHSKVHQETLLSIDFEIDEKQECKIRTE
jgi:hypothetical protein